MDAIINYAGTPIKYNSGNVRLNVEKKRIDVNRGRISFSGNLLDDNHCIYNNYLNLDGGGRWDGIKINCFEGLRIRTGPNGANQKLEVNNDKVVATVPVEAPLIRSVFQVVNLDQAPSQQNVGAIRYREDGSSSFLEVCMRNNPTPGDPREYIWKEIVEN